MDRFVIYMTMSMMWPFPIGRIYLGLAKMYGRQFPKNSYGLHSKRKHHCTGTILSEQGMWVKGSNIHLMHSEISCTSVSALWILLSRSWIDQWTWPLVIDSNGHYTKHLREKVSSISVDLLDFQMDTTLFNTNRSKIMIWSLFCCKYGNSVREVSKGIELRKALPIPV